MPVAVRLSKLLVDRFGNFARFDAKLEQRVASLDAKIDQRTATLDAKIDQRVAELRERISEVKSELLKWMFIFWASTIVPLGGLMFALQKL